MRPTPNQTKPSPGLDELAIVPPAPKAVVLIHIQDGVLQPIVCNDENVLFIVINEDTLAEKSVNESFDLDQVLHPVPAREIMPFRDLYLSACSCATHYKAKYWQNRYNV